MAERFYVNSPLMPGPIVLEGPEAHHLAVVCRLRPGEPIYLFNGDGCEYSAEVVQVARKSVQLSILERIHVDRELGFRLCVACPLPKGDRTQFLVEKLTELGCTSLVPMRTRHAAAHSMPAKGDKLKRYVIEASKQCGRNRLMHIDPDISWDAFARQGDLPWRRWLAHPGAPTLSPCCTPADTAIAVGPEGGFAAEELALAQKCGWQLVGLGPRILRVETAAIALAALAAVGQANSGD